MSRVIVLGGGASGMAAGIEAARRGERVLILERMSQMGKKLLATGNGRCNLMNRNPLIYYGEEGFARAVMGEDPVRELTEFWEGLGLRIRYDEAGRGYPCTFQAATVVEALTDEIRRLGIEVRTGYDSRGLEPAEDGFHLELADGEGLTARRVILATGGAAQPKLGGNTDALRWLRRMGHQIAEPRPALTPLRTDGLSIRGLSGLRVKGEVTLYGREEPRCREQGEILFGDSGISGICVMQCARFAEPGESEIGINLVYDLFPDTEALARELKRRQQARGGESPEALLAGLCARKMGYAVCKQAGIPLRGEKAGELTEAQIHAIAARMRDYRVRITGIEGFDRAQVMAGGVRCNEVRPENMESRRVPGLHLAGELLDVDGDCGGFNLMFAFLSGIRAGRNERG